MPAGWSERRALNLAPLAIGLALILSLLTPWLLRTLVFASSFGQRSPEQQELLHHFVAAAIERTHHIVRYDPAYVRIPYPGGDVPAGTGVCTDEVIRAYRAVGIDLQKLVHEDMAEHRSAYPFYGKGSAVHSGSQTDSNIDHRRVPNLMVFFARHGELLPASTNAGDYHPGDVVAWNLGGGITHIGIVVDQRSPASGRFEIVHNIGRGPQMEDVLLNWKIIGHYRYFGNSAANGIAYLKN